MSTHSNYLRQLADELMEPCMEAVPDEGDRLHLLAIADSYDKLIAALEGVIQGMEQPDVQEVVAEAKGA